MNIDDIAFGRCQKLLELAREMFPEDKALSRRYVELARKIAMRHRIPLGSKEFCKKCGIIFIHGKTLNVRISPSKGAAVYICTNCKSEKRYPFSKHKKSERQMPKPSL